MNFDWLKNSSITARVLTLSTAGVVAGLVAYNALTSPDYENGTAFSDLGRQNVAYTSGSNASYDGQKLVSANDLNRVDKEYARANELRAQQEQQGSNIRYVQDEYNSSDHGSRSRLTVWRKQTNRSHRPQRGNPDGIFHS